MYNVKFNFSCIVEIKFKSVANLSQNYLRKYIGKS